MEFVIEAVGLTVAGGKELALDLMASLATHTEHEFIFIVPDLEDYRFISGRNIRTTVCERGAGLLRRDRLLNYEVPRICREAGADALLCLGNFPSRRPGCPTAVLLQNAWMVYRDPAAESRRGLREKLVTAYGRHLYRNLRSDVTIITQTQVMKDHLCEQYGINPGRVAIIPNTFSLARPGGNVDRAPSSVNRGARPFTFLCLAHYYPHKNIDILVDASRNLSGLTGKPAKCVITVDPQQHPGARRLLAHLGRGNVVGEVQNIGPIPSELLPSVYRSADALIFPTLLESYSRTYLEAMYFGLPILTSDRDFAHYLCGDAAIFFDPLDARSIARTMARVMEDADLRQTLVEKGKRILAQAPTWQQIANRFVDVLERTAKGEPPIDAEARSWHTVRSFQCDPSRWAAAITPANLLAGISDRNAIAGPQAGPCQNDNSSTDGAPAKSSPARAGDQPHRFANLPAKGSVATLAAGDVRTLFNRKARYWHCKYGPKMKLNSRVEQFTTRLSQFCMPPRNVLDLGCGTGQIAAAIGQMGYPVTACDFAEEMIEIARNDYAGTSVQWVCLEPHWEVLPFADASFDAVVASSVFEYLVDVPAVVAELARVLRPEGVLLLTVPNPFNPVRKFEAWFHSMVLRHRLSLLPKVQRIDSYASYLRLSRNRFRGGQLESLLAGAGFMALDKTDFSDHAWLNQSKAPLILLAVKKTLASPVVDQLESMLPKFATISSKRSDLMT